MGQGRVQINRNPGNENCASLSETEDYEDLGLTKMGGRWIMLL